MHRSGFEVQGNDVDKQDIGVSNVETSSNIHKKKAKRHAFD